MPVTRKQEPPYGLRMPIGMRERVKRLAEANGRSMNAEIVFRLRCALGEAAGDEFGRKAPAAEDDKTALAGGSI